MKYPDNIKALHKDFSRRLLRLTHAKILLGVGMTVKNELKQLMSAPDSRFVTRRIELPQRIIDGVRVQGRYDVMIEYRSSEVCADAYDVA